MSKCQQVFENEEAEKLLDYFVAYRKLSETADYIRCLSKVNSEVTFNEIAQPTPTPMENLAVLVEK
jgi:hypothetical protein